MTENSENWGFETIRKRGEKMAIQEYDPSILFFNWNGLELGKMVKATYMGGSSYHPAQDVSAPHKGKPFLFFDARSLSIEGGLESYQKGMEKLAKMKGRPGMSKDLVERLKEATTVAIKINLKEEQMTVGHTYAMSWQGSRPVKKDPSRTYHVFEVYDLTDQGQDGTSSQETPENPGNNVDW